MSAHEDILRALQSGKYALAKRLLVSPMREAALQADHRRLAWGHTCLGKMAEEEGQIGDAIRNWSAALHYYTIAGDTCTIEVERLRQLILAWRKHREIFVSYAREDSARVTGVLRYIRARQRARFRVDTDFLAGKSITEQVTAAIRECPTFLVFFSPRYAARSWTNFELEQYRLKAREDRATHATDCQLIFFCLDGWQEHARIIEDFSSYLHIDMSEGLLRAKRKLARALGGEGDG